MNRISTVIVTYNSQNVIAACLDSIKAQNIDSETILIDNGSKDATLEIVRNRYPWVKLSINARNEGAAKARNQGIRISQGEWVLTLDCDTILEDNFFTSAQPFLESLPKNIGIVQPKILASDKKTIYSCGNSLSWLKRVYDIGRGVQNDNRFCSPKEIDGACAAAALYRREMLEGIREEAAYFDERFFFLLEDVDLALRAQRKGWKTIFYPKAVCFHDGNSSCAGTHLRQYLCWRNRKLLLKNFKLFPLNVFVISCLYDFPRLMFLFLTNKYVRLEVARKKCMFDFCVKNELG